MRYIFIPICFIDYIFYAIFASEKEHKRYKQYGSNEVQQKRDNEESAHILQHGWRQPQEP